MPNIANPTIFVDLTRRILPWLAAATAILFILVIALAGLLLEANLRYHREAYHIQLRKYGAPAVQRASGRFPRVVAG